MNNTSGCEIPYTEHRQKGVIHPSIITALFVALLLIAIGVSPS